MSHIIVVGNEKGGAGKSTVSMHVATALSRMGKSVAVIDLDLRQKTLARFLENRLAFLLREGMDLPTPDYQDLPEIAAADLAPGENANDRRLSDAVTALEGRVDFIVIDCPGSHTRLAQVAHSLADTLITPMNDSFVDFGLLGRVDPQTYRVKGPSAYSEMEWECRKRRAVSDGGEIDWIVIRNRLSHVDAKNKRRVEAVLDALAQRIGFRCGPGFGERVIFREMFPSGLTLLDLREEGVDAQMSMSHVAARAEVRALTEALDLPDLSREEA